jgi:hypothetical protein
MHLLLAFAAIMIVGVTCDVLISLQVESYFKPAGLPTFFVLLALLIVGGWRTAVRLTAPKAKSVSSAVE